MHASFNFFVRRDKTNFKLNTQAFFSVRHEKSIRFSSSSISQQIFTSWYFNNFNMGQISLELYLIFFSNLSKLSSRCECNFFIYGPQFRLFGNSQYFFASSQIKREKIRRVRYMVVRNANLFFYDAKKNTWNTVEALFLPVFWRWQLENWFQPTSRRFACMAWEKTAVEKVWLYVHRCDHCQNMNFDYIF